MKNEIAAAVMASFVDAEQTPAEFIEKGIWPKPTHDDGDQIDPCER
jgi:hypothetical protein